MNNQRWPSRNVSAARPRNGCFLLAATGSLCTSDGRPLLASISDNPYDIRTIVRTLASTTTGLAHIGTELVSVSHRSLEERGYLSGSHETTRGINEAGLALTGAAVFLLDDSSVQPQRAASVTDVLMQTCCTVDDAIERINQADTQGMACNLMLADSNGKVAQVEVSRGEIAVHKTRSPENPGVLLAVNCFQSLDVPVDPRAHPSYNEGNNGCRLDRGSTLIHESECELDVWRLGQILSDHENRHRDPADNPLIPGWGYSICNHGTRHDERPGDECLAWGTVSAEILDPIGCTFWFAYGWPCGEAPTAGDQCLQDHSWGRFVPFRLTSTTETAVYTTPTGEITPAGRRACS